RGIMLSDDLKNVGIVRAIPHIYERSLTRWLWDKLRDERGAITTYDDLLTAKRTYKHETNPRGNKQTFPSTSNIWSCSHLVGGFPGAGTSFTSIPGGAVMKRADSSLAPGLTDPTSPDKKYLISLGFGPPGSTSLNVGIIADLLVAAGAIDSNSNAAQTVNTTALTRYTSGAGVLVGCSVDSASALGTTASNLTLTKYTDQNGNTLHSSPAQAMITGAAQNRMTPVTLGPFLQLAAGDYGVRSVEEVQLSAAMGTAGRTFALHLFKPLCFLPVTDGNVYCEYDFTEHIHGLVELVTDGSGVLGCLTGYFNFGLSSGALNFQIVTVNG